MDLTVLLVQLVSGAVGGARRAPRPNNICSARWATLLPRAVGGGIVGELVGTLAGQSIEGWVGNFGGGAVGGIILTLLVGVINNMTPK